jgi:HPt (histidine-containing phosphotransfer) domain-containing protein
MEQSDSNQLCRLIHQLKGACGSYGFHEVTPQATILEEQLRSGVTMIALVDRLEDFLETCQRFTADPV